MGTPKIREMFPRTEFQAKLVIACTVLLVIGTLGIVIFFGLSRKILAD